MNPFQFYVAASGAADDGLFASPYCWGISVCGLVVEFFADRKENIRHGELLKVQ